MLTKSWRRRLVRALAVLTVVVSLSGLAQAQQSGLFPLHPIKRERVPCAAEDPIYKLYRSQYYGYFPTQWRPFPQGWNLPSPEGPNTEAALAKQPIEGPKAPEADEGEGDDMQGPPDRGGRQPIPNPPPDTERSPFEMDKPDNAGAPGAGAPARRPAPPAGGESLALRHSGYNAASGATDTATQSSIGCTASHRDSGSGTSRRRTRGTSDLAE